MVDKLQDAPTVQSQPAAIAESFIQRMIDICTQVMTKYNEVKNESDAVIHFNADERKMSLAKRPPNQFLKLRIENYLNELELTDIAEKDKMILAEQ